MSSLSQAIAVPKSSHGAPALLSRLRLSQIRLFASFLAFLGRRPVGRQLIVHFRSWPPARLLIEWCLGFRKTFSSFEAAQAFASHYIRAGHEHQDELDYHLSASHTLRESDYPLLFHLAPLAGAVRRVFDLGGNVGNLLYSYEKQLNFPADLAWLIYDLPAQIALGQKIAAERGDSRLHFVQNLAAGRGSDVFISSGSLHYFPQPLGQILLSLGSLPAHVFVNRTPCSNGHDLITVQDNGTYLVPCKLHSRSELLRSMEHLGYRLIAQWPVHELKLSVPTYPDLSPACYSGFYFRRD